MTRVYTKSFRIKAKSGKKRREAVRLAKFLGYKRRTRNLYTKTLKR